MDDGESYPSLVKPFNIKNHKSNQRRMSQSDHIIHSIKFIRVQSWKVYIKPLLDPWKAIKVRVCIPSTLHYLHFPNI